jgi:hypothetical protein
MPDRFREAITDLWDQSYPESWMRGSEKTPFHTPVNNMVTSEDVALGDFSPCRLSYQPRSRRGSPLNRWLVAAATVVMMAGLGSFNAWSVFRRPLSELYGANVTDVNTAFFVSSLVFGLVVSVSASWWSGWVPAPSASAAPSPTGPGSSRAASPGRASPCCI